MAVHGMTLSGPVYKGALALRDDTGVVTLLDLYGVVSEATIEASEKDGKGGGGGRRRPKGPKSPKAPTPQPPAGPRHDPPTPACDASCRASVRENCPNGAFFYDCFSVEGTCVCTYSCNASSTSPSAP